MRILIVGTGALLLAACGQPSGQPNGGPAEGAQYGGPGQDQASDQDAAADNAKIEAAMSRSPVNPGYTPDELRQMAIESTSRYNLRHAEVIGMVVNILKYGFINHQNVPLMFQSIAKLSTTMRADLPAATEKVVGGMISILTGNKSLSLVQFDMLSANELQSVQELVNDGKQDAASLQFLQFLIAGISEPRHVN